MNLDTNINVVCIKWGDKYSAEYVNKLYSMVQRHLTLPHRFVCFTDNPEGIDDGIETKELLSNNLEGWWNKLSLFKEDVSDLSGEILFLDLDVVIVSRIDYLFSDRVDEPFLSLEDFIQPKKTFNSSVFRLKIGSCTSVWDKSVNLERDGQGSKAFGRHFHGDQDYITYVLYPFGEHLKHCFSEKKIISYKRGGDPSPETSIVVFHGSPNPHEVSKSWVRQNWC